MSPLPMSGRLRRLQARPAGRFLSEAECQALAQRLMGMAVGGGQTAVFINSSWTGNVAWGRNQITTCGDVRDNRLELARAIRGAVNGLRVIVNHVDDASLEAAVHRAERLLLAYQEQLEDALRLPAAEPYDTPQLWFDRTYQLDAAGRAAAMRAVVQPAEAAGLLSAGYLEVSAHGHAILTSEGRAVYHPSTHAQLSMTVRDPTGTASGWAGVDWNDWGQIAPDELAAIAVEKCLAARNPATLEPGRYTVILEPQAVCDLLLELFGNLNTLDRKQTEDQPDLYPFGGAQIGETKIGEQVIDARLTVSTDPMDPMLGFVPIAAGFVGMDIRTYHPVTWIKDGVLQTLGYDRDPYGIRVLGVNAGLPVAGAFHMTGGPTSVAEMIATTKRGLLVTRFSGVNRMDGRSMLVRGYTRDGLWLVEDGKVSKPVKNFRFLESVLGALNRVVQLGPPQRVFHPDAPVVVPPLKIADFNFTTLIDAV